MLFLSLVTPWHIFPSPPEQFAGLYPQSVTVLSKNTNDQSTKFTLGTAQRPGASWSLQRFTMSSFTYGRPMEILRCGRSKGQIFVGIFCFFNQQLQLLFHVTPPPPPPPPESQLY